MLVLQKTNIRTGYGYVECTVVTDKWLSFRTEGGRRVVDTTWWTVTFVGMVLHSEHGQLGKRRRRICRVLKTP